MVNIFHAAYHSHKRRLLGRQLQNYIITQYICILDAVMATVWQSARAVH